MEYGYINKSGYLRTRELQEQRRQYRDGNEIKTRIITIEEQAEELSLKDGNLWIYSIKSK